MFFDRFYIHSPSEFLSRIKATKQKETSEDGEEASFVRRITEFASSSFWQEYYKIEDVGTVRSCGLK